MTVEAIKQEIGHLPEQERKQLLDWLEQVEKHAWDRGIDRDFAPGGSRPCASPEQNWIANHRDRYVGEWVALDGAALIAHDRNGKTAYDLARAVGVHAPFVAYIDPEPTTPFAGW